MYKCYVLPLHLCKEKRIGHKYFFPFFFPRSVMDNATSVEFRILCITLTNTCFLNLYYRHANE